MPMTESSSRSKQTSEDYDERTASAQHAGTLHSKGDLRLPRHLKGDAPKTHHQGTYQGEVQEV